MTAEVQFDAPPRPGASTAPDTDLEIEQGPAVGGFRLAELGDRFGSPFFLYDLDVVTRRVSALRAVLPPPFRLAYAVKANPNPAVLGHLAGLGLGADVASGGELAAALRAGFPAARIVFTGPGKRDVELAAAVDAEVGCLTVESPLEMARLERIAAAAGRRQPILLRRSVPPDATTEAIRIVGDDGAGKFGMDDADVRACAAVASRSDWLELLGVHAFGASNIRDAAELVAHARATVAFGRTVMAELGLRPGLIDVGGGLGIPYRDDEAPLALGDLGRRLVELTGEWSADPVLRATVLLIEPGRFLVGPAGVYVTRVLDRKTVRGRQIAIVDGGIHHLIRPALVGQDHRVVRIGEDAQDDRSPVTVAGPLCSGLDILARDAPLGLPAVGEPIVVRDVGAYGFTESMPLFLSHPTPAELVLSDGRIVSYPGNDPVVERRGVRPAPATR